MATATQPYPFSNLAKTPSMSMPANATTPPREALLKGKGLMQHLAETLATPDKRKWLDTYFARRHPLRIIPGSVLNVGLGHTPTNFTGVLLSVRRRGLDTSFLLRNVINRTGVEMQFFVCSPHVKSIRILQRAVTKSSKGGPKIRRAKLFYLRDSPEKMTAISAGVRG